MDKVYGIFSGAYSDWSVHGFLEDKDEARKYCAVKNENYGDENGYNFYVVEIEKINANVKDVKLKYYHQVVFDFGEGMRQEPDRYKYYIGKDKQSKTIYNVFKNGTGWISFEFNCESREKAEKIAQDKYASLLYYYSENNNWEESAKLIGAIHQ